MEYKRFGNDIVLSLVKGDEVMAGLKELALNENIKLASIEGLGATNDFTVGLFETASKKYFPHDYSGDHEIVSLTGSINTMNDEYYSHLHMACANKEGTVVGGHLSRCVISGVGEIFVHVIDGRVDREFNEDIGLNIFKF